MSYTLQNYILTPETPNFCPLILTFALRKNDMPQQRSRQRPPKRQFYMPFLLIGLLLAGVRYAFPEVTAFSLAAWGEQEEASPLHPVLAHSQFVDSLFRGMRSRPLLIDSKGREVVNRIVSVPSFDEAFPDLNPVQLATAKRIGVAACQNRAEASVRIQSLVYVGDSPFYQVETLTHSIPYLVPRAATLLDQISRAFLDSLASKGLPFHKPIVTSVLRTTDDIQLLRRRNQNASENSCHRFGTTFDIAYNKFLRVQDPDLPEQEATWGVHLKSVLAEVLADQRRLGTCYVKYEKHQACFHITAR